MSLLNELKPGSPVTVSYLNTSHRYETAQLTYVGLIENEYLIIRFPNKRVLVNSANNLVPGAMLTLKAILSGETLNVINFKASSLGISKLREPLLLVQFPQRIETKAIRATPRLSVEAMANVRLSESEVEHLTLVSDFSLTGLKCEFNVTLEENSSYNKTSVELLVGQKVTIDFGVNQDFESDFQVSGEIKNSRLAQEKALLGIQFDEAESDMVRSIFAILLMRLHGL